MAKLLGTDLSQFIWNLHCNRWIHDCQFLPLQAASKAFEPGARQAGEAEWYQGQGIPLSDLTQKPILPATCAVRISCPESDRGDMQYEFV